MDKEEVVFNSSALLYQLNWKAATERLPVIVFIGLLLLMGLAGNIHVLYIFKYKFSPSTYRIFILFLSTIDLTCCCVSMPFEIADELQPLTFHEIVSCKVFRFINICIAISSALALVVIATERFRKICRPHGNQMSVSSAFYWTIAVVIISIVITFPALYVYGLKAIHISYNGTVLIGSECTWGDHMRNTLYGYFFYAWVLSIIIICMVSLVALYSLIGIRLRKRTKYLKMKSTQQLLKTTETAPAIEVLKMDSLREFDSTVSGIKPLSINNTLAHASRRESSESNQSQAVHRLRQKSTKGNKITRTLFALTLVFILSYLPYIVILIVYSANPKYDQNMTSLERILRLIGLRLYMINSVFNPIVYGFFDSKFREHFTSIYRSLCNF